MKEHAGESDRFFGLPRPPRRETDSIETSGDLAFAPFWVLSQACLRAVLSPSIEGPPAPRRGGLLVVANHLSLIDPAVLQMAFHRRIRYLMTEEFHDRPGLRWFFRWMRTLRVRDDGRNLASLREAREALRLGEVVGLFPEGQLSPDGKLGPLRPGAAALAGLAGVPVQPVRIGGTFPIWRRGMLLPHPAPVKLRRRPVLPPPTDRAGREELTRRIREALEADR